MKTKRIIYFLLIVFGAVLMASDSLFSEKEYALCIGLILLMFGIYKSSKVWSPKDKEDNNHIKNEF